MYARLYSGTNNFGAGQAVRLMGLDCHTFIGISGYVSAQNVMAVGTYFFNYGSGFGASLGFIPDYRRSFGEPEWVDVAVYPNGTYAKGSGSLTVNSYDGQVIAGVFGGDFVPLSHTETGRIQVSGSFNLPVTPPPVNPSIC